jgi:hypothetical protein
MRKSPLVIASALIAAFPSLAAAANDPWSAPFSIQIGGFDANATTKVRLDSSSGANGTSGSFEGDLGLEERKTLPTFDFTWRWNRRHALEGSIVSLHRDGSRTLTGQINWGDVTFPVSTTVTSKFDSDIVRVGYRYSFVNEPGGEFSMLLGLHWTNLDTGISNVAGTISKSVSVDFPLPTVGLRGSARLGDNWRLAGFGQFLKLKIGDYDGSILNGSVAVEWAFLRQAYAGLGYNYYKYKLTAEKENAHGKFDFRFDGPALYVGWAF